MGESALDRFAYVTRGSQTFLCARMLNFSQHPA